VDGKREDTSCHEQRPASWLGADARVAARGATGLQACAAGQLPRGINSITMQRFGGATTAPKNCTMHG
jgi:hypothetical protein